MSKFKKIAFIFPGQGSQYPGMGADFLAQYKEAQHVFEEADDLLGRKISSIILQGPADVLTETQNSQTAIFVMSIALLRVLEKNFPSLKPSVCGGLSLGEYTALTASGRLDFKDCLPLVQRRGQYMSDACNSSEGTMAVVLGLDGDVVENMVKELDLPKDLWAANFNCPGQVVISGTKRGIESGSAAAKAKGAKRVLPLAVHGAFHSGLMQSAEDRLAPYILETSLKNTPIEFVMNVPGDFVHNDNEIQANLITQVTHPVRWEQSIRKMDQAGVDLFIEIGCGKTLAGFNKRIAVQAPTMSIEKVEDLENLNALLGA